MVKLNIKIFLGQKKNLKNLLKVGDIIYVKKLMIINYSLKQLPKINGGIVVMDPYTGRVVSFKWWV